MKLFRFLAIIIALFFVENLYSQNSDISVHWSDMQNYSNKTGYFKKIVGTNSKYIYVLQDLVSGHSIHSWRKCRLTIFDKKTMQSVASVPLKGFEENKKNKDILRNMYPWQFVISDDHVYVFWLKETREADMLYAQAFTPDLKEKITLKKVYELKSKKGDKKKAELFVLSNKKHQILLGGELSASKGENIKLQYRLLDADLSFMESNQVTLPIVASRKKSNHLSFDYTLGDNKMLYALTQVVVGKGKKTEDMYIFSGINIEKGTIKTIELADRMHTISNISFLIGEKYLRFTGFYNKKGENNNKVTGLFSANINKYNLKFVGSPSFSKFTPQYIHILSKNDHRNAKSNRKKKRDKKKELNLVPYYTLIKSMEYRGQLIQIYTIYYEYSITTCSKNGCVTKYYQDNYNILAISISKSGEINWMTKTERVASYKGWGHEDVNIIKDKNRYYIFYAEDFIFNAQKKRWVRKSRNMRLTMLNYSVLNPQNGEMTAKTYVSNALKEPAKTRKYILAENMIAYDNEIYINYLKVRKKPSAIALTVLLSPTIIGAFLPGRFASSFHGYGYVGKIEIKH